MITSSVQTADARLSTVVATLSAVLGEPVVSAEPIGFGRNSQVYKVTGPDARRYVGKFYFRHPLDGRNRLVVEFSSLQFLQSHGVTNVPVPIAVDERRGCAVYEYIDGDPIVSADVTVHDIEAAVDFLATLRRLRDAQGSRTLPLASEASFSFSAIMANLEQRFSRLSAVSSDEDQYLALCVFLQREWRPAYERITRWCRAGLERVGMPLERELPEQERTLSPSDFGFHNALRRDGRLVFFDFEYFGWDDPAKTAADFLLHPAMSLPEELKRRFVSTLVSRLEGGTAMSQRVELVYPLYGLKWCLLLLNEFVPQDLLRRGLAQRSARKRATIQEEQLNKSRRMLERITHEYEHFPYCY